MAYRAESKTRIKQHLSCWWVLVFQWLVWRKQSIMAEVVDALALKQERICFQSKSNV